MKNAVTPHTFRRSCTTELLRGGANMYPASLRSYAGQAIRLHQGYGVTSVKELLGHESLETLKHYAKFTITDLKATHAKCHPREKDVGE
jgi:site-specific recombinase XerD